MYIFYYNDWKEMRKIFLIYFIPEYFIPEQNTGSRQLMLNSSLGPYMMDWIVKVLRDSLFVCNILKKRVTRDKRGRKSKSSAHLYDIIYARSRMYLFAYLILEFVQLILFKNSTFSTPQTLTLRHVFTYS